MAGMIIQHNLNAINANNRLGVNILGTKKATEKLSSGYRINRAADDAAGLAISEKMRAQLRGIGQAIRNANDGISLIQTAEGALDETHDMLKRLKELAVMCGNETYSDEEREYAQMEIDQIKEEIDRIALSTNFNGIKLLDGSLGGNSKTTEYGPAFASIDTSTGIFGGTVVSASKAGVKVNFANSTSGEFASWDETGMTLTINIRAGVSYSQAQIDSLIKDAATRETNQNNIPEVSVKLGSGVALIDNTGYGALAATVAGVRATATGTLTPFLVGTANGNMKVADRITFTSNNFGQDLRTFSISTDTAVTAGKESVTMTAEANPNVKNGAVTINLVAGVEYSEAQIEALLAKAGLDYTVELKSSINPDGDVKFKASANIAATQVADLTGGAPQNITTYTSTSLAAFTTAISGLATNDPASNWAPANYTTFNTALAALVAANSSLQGGALDVTTTNANINAVFAAATALTAADMDDRVGTTTTTAGLTAADVAELSTAIDNFVGAIDDLRDDINAITAAGGPNSGAAVDAAVQKFNTYLTTAGVTNINDAITKFNGIAGTNIQLIAELPEGGALDVNTALERADALQVVADNLLGIATAGKGGQGVGADRALSTGKGITFQIGANNAVEQRVTLSINEMTSRAIGIANFDVSTLEAAQGAMDSVEAAIVVVSQQRASLGAMQNRLEHTVNSLTVTHENLTAAEAQIRDADMAMEMVSYTKFNILQQAAQAMLAQANQAPQAILQLLR